MSRSTFSEILQNSWRCSSFIPKESRPAFRSPEDSSEPPGRFLGFFAQFSHPLTVFMDSQGFFEDSFPSRVNLARDSSRFTDPTGDSRRCFTPDLSYHRDSLGFSKILRRRQEQVLQFVQCNQNDTKATVKRKMRTQRRAALPHGSARHPAHKRIRKGANNCIPSVLIRVCCVQNVIPFHSALRRVQMAALDVFHTIRRMQRVNQIRRRSAGSPVHSTFLY